jgi:hypothetical protein
MYPLRRGRSEPEVGRGGDSSWGRGRGRARTRFRPRSRLRPGPGVGRGGDHLPRSRLRPSLGVGRGGDHLPRPRRGLLLRLRPKVGRGGASCGAWGWTQLLSASPWRVAQQSERGERRCFPVRSVSGRAKWLRSLRPCRLRHACQDKAPGDPCIECACDTVGWWGDLAKVASQRSLSELGFGRVEGAPVAEEALGRGVNSPGTTVLARGRARATQDCVPWVDETLTWIAPIRLCSLRWWWLPAELRSVGGTPNYGTRQIAWMSSVPCACSGHHACMCGQQKKKRAPDAL